MLKAAGVERVFSEKVSGVAAKRPELERVLDELEAGDVLVETKLDRLARSTLDLLRIIDLIGKGRLWLQEPWRALGGHHDVGWPSHADCSIRHCRVRILQPTNEGRMRAMAEGTRFGRTPKLTKHQAREASKRVAAGETLREIALSYNVDHSTISRLRAPYAAEVF
jgi:DNA invertase Pin-like site-specific DNA recombinase